MIREAIAQGFKRASAIRRTKVFHPKGTVYDATVTIPEQGKLLGSPGTHRALVRLSRGAGLPKPLPDLLGFAVRIVDAHGQHRHQDLLLVTSLDLPLVRFALLPALDFDDHDYTSSLPYETPEGLALVVAHLKDGRAEIKIAPPTGRSRTIATVELGAEHTGGEEPRFDPGITGPDLRPAGYLNRLRERAYSASQAGWMRFGRRLRT